MSALTSTALDAGAPRHGAIRWMRSYLSMMRFEAASQRDWLGLMLIIELLLGAGMAVMYGFYVASIPPRLAAFIVTGTPALALVPVGFVMLPGAIARRKLAGNYDYVRSLPAPRSATIAATASVFTLMVIPGAAVSLGVAAWRYGVTLHISPLIVPAVLLTSLMASSVGAAIGHGIRDPTATSLIGNLIIFAVLLYTPVAFPPQQFPAWLVHLHEGLPFYNMAIVLRAALSHGLVSDVGRGYAVLAGWTLVGLAFAGWVTSRRR
ncbi:MAG: ABC transporter permease [Solirubrobacteraceae bacterium]